MHRDSGFLPQVGCKDSKKFATDNNFRKKFAKKVGFWGIIGISNAFLRSLL